MVMAGSIANHMQSLTICMPHLLTAGEYLYWILSGGENGQNEDM